ncbi:type 2 glycerol-3-phosphate oxidase [Spiroplasma endosymbiont of Anurida maritima]|uniref:type 2 glycerol-3-phosphate oxidase n=1 Tax=Spiroplasma endosymbiont of Anurida maritima TaxID=2967972 RepID=UPI0036D3A19E
MPNKIHDICIIGAGIIGAACSYEISKLNKSILVLEKNNKPAMETTEGNSAVIHGGFDPTPGKLNATLSIEGKKLYQTWFKELNFTWKKVDSLVIAFSPYEINEVKKLYERGLENGLDKTELKILNSYEEVKKYEPNVNTEVLGALYCSSSHIIDPIELTNELLKKSNADVHLKTKVTAIKFIKDKKYFEIQTNNNVFFAKQIINAAGHYADDIADMVNARNFELFRRRGEYRILELDEAHKVKNIVFMAPTIHGKGVIVSPITDGHVLVGPTAEDGIRKEDVRLVTQEMYRKIGEIGKKIIPELNIERTYKVMAGSRPIIQKTDDFLIELAKDNKNFLNIAGIKSPGITAAPAIGKYVIKLLNL